jgi:hypothetical protein
VLIGMKDNSARVVTTKRMEAIFRREEIVYAAECRISARVDEKGKVLYTPEIMLALSIGEGIHFCSSGQVDEVFTLIFHSHRLQRSTGGKTIFQRGIQVARPNKDHYQ